MIESIEYTNRGCRECNQDYVLSKTLSASSSLFVIADGMGGYAHGEVASMIVATAISEFVEINFNKYSPSILLRDAVAFANENLMLKRVALNGDKMGCVIAALLIVDDEAYLTWLGDSRIYIFRNGQQIYRTEDHSVVNELSKIKSLTSDDIERYSAIVTRSVMGDDNLGKVPIAKLGIEAGDVFVLCTDGFYKELPMEKALSFIPEKEKDLDKLTLSVSDNYSFIKVQF